jgi:hypothetical protein
MEVANGLSLVKFYMFYQMVFIEFSYERKEI